MKQTTKLTIILNLFLGLSMAANAQTPAAADQHPELKYRRSSLHLILLESEDFPRKEVVMKAYHEAPFPDKYNNHSISTISVDPSTYVLTDAEKATAGTKKSGMGNFGASMLSGVTAGIVDKDASDMPFITGKIVKDKKIANQLVAKWFNRQADGSFDMKLISDRGSYDATEMQANIAKGSARGTSSLSDAGEELIKNTFVVLTKLKFVSNEPIAAAIREVAKLKAGSLPALFQPAAYKVLDMAYNKAKEGYSVWTTSYLYRLKWNDSTAAVFYNDLWIDKTAKIDKKRKEAFDKTDLFQLEYIGSEKSSSLVTFSLKETRTEDQIVELATVRNVEHVFAKLQKAYEVFKPKTPIYSGDPVTAKSGMTEGLEGGEKFEVLEQTVDAKTGLTTYVKKGTVTVDKKQIWDNRFNAGEEVSANDKDDKKKDKDKDKPAIDRTYFKGGGKFYAGMLLRQIK
jgi:hypothetical protein